HTLYPDICCTNLHEQLVETIEPGLEIIRLFAVPDPQVSIHPEVIAGDDQNTFSLAQPGDQLDRIDSIVVTKIGDCTGVGRRVAEEIAVRIEPPGEDGKILVENRTSAREQP